MRSSTIAAEFLRLGHEVWYVGEIDSMGLIDERLEELGLRDFTIHPNDFQSISNTDYLLMDSYTVSPRDPFLDKDKWFRRISVSDSVTPQYDVDLEIQPSLVPKKDGTKSHRVLSGPKFILLRDTLSTNFRRLASDRSPIRILIVGGGSDPSGFCDSLAAKLLQFSNSFVLDIFSDNLDLALLRDHRVRVHKVSLAMDHYSNKCDLAFTLASSLSIELIAQGIPIGLAAAFDNQLNGFQEIIELGFGAPIGVRNPDGQWSFDETMLAAMVSSETFRDNLRLRVAGLIDLRGPQRIASEILRL